MHNRLRIEALTNAELESVAYMEGNGVALEMHRRWQDDLEQRDLEIAELERALREAGIQLPKEAEAESEEARHL